MTEALTYQDFLETFNAISRGYHACGMQPRGIAIVADTTGELMAYLTADSRTWDFKESCFNFKELFLMAKLAATSPELRGGINND